MIAGSEALLLATMMVLSMASFWPGIMNGSVFFSLDLHGLVLCDLQSKRAILWRQNNLAVS
jgi:hypothetical protein